MTKCPHALFTRVRHGVSITIEINSLTHGHNVLEFRNGMSPFWSYKAGFDKTPVWNNQFRYAYGSTPGELSYITLLRMAVATLTSGGMGFIGVGKPKLGFHSKYKAMKRAKVAGNH
jgi:hypothetical protein